MLLWLTMAACERTNRQRQALPQHSRQAHCVCSCHASFNSHIFSSLCLIVISFYSSSIKVVRRLKDSMGINLHLVDASERFLAALEGVSDPERKRKIIGATFIEIFQVSTIIALFTPHCISFLRGAFCEHSASGLLYFLFFFALFRRRPIASEKWTSCCKELFIQM
jgi:hypothetical protein